MNWLGEILPFAQHLLQTNGPVGARARRRGEARAEVDEQIRAAEAAYTLHREEAMARTLEHAPLLGIKKSSPIYEQTVSAMADAIVAEELQGLSMLRERLSDICREESADRESARLSARLDGIRNWSAMDEEQQNQILRALFDKIVISPSPLLPARRKRLMEAGADQAILNQGTITLYLRGVADPLPDIRMFRGSRSGRAVVLESPHSWLSSMFGIKQVAAVDTTPARCRINSGHLVSFLTYMRRYASQSSADPIDRLAVAVKSDKGQPRIRLTVQRAVRDYLEVRGFDADVLAALGAAWEMYMESERDRILPKLGKRYGQEAACQAWVEYFEAQDRRFKRTECSIK